MSLINDALKRASQAKTPPALPTPPETPLQPVERGSTLIQRLALAPAVLLVLGVAGWFFYKSWQAGHLPDLSSNKIPVGARETDPAAPKAGQTGGKTAAVSNDIPQQPLSPPATALSSTNSPEPDKPSFPTLRLQGIFYRARNPSVMLNSKTVSVGDKVAGAKVVAITRDSVTLQWNGETKVLTFE
jgi:hypothetical protein